MRRTKCEICGRRILKSGHDDPYICRECEETAPLEEIRHSYLNTGE